LGLLEVDAKHLRMGTARLGDADGALG